MSLLTLCQSATDRIGLPRPTVIVSGTDETTRRLLALAQEEGKALCREGDWQQLTAESTFTTLAQESQTSAFPTDLARFVDDTFWNRTRGLRLDGPLSAQEWQAQKAASAAGIFNAFRVRGNAILINPVPTAGETLAWEYIKNTFCESSGGTDQSAWAADTDTGILSEELMALGIVWRYKKSKGLAWQPDYEVYRYQVDQALTQNKPHAIVNMTGSGRARVPGIVVPDGNWDL